jgi:ubiquinone/menaquinone biosynthesis C-methylase UbiE
MTKISFFLGKILALFFDLLYHSFAWSYDGVAWLVSAGLWNQWVLACLPYLQGPRVLELGFGPGHLQAALSKQNRVKAFGLDESPQMVRLCSWRLNNQPKNYYGGYAYNTFLSRGRAQRLPYANQSLNTVVATFPSPYILDPLTLAEVFRILTPGGHLVIGLSAEFTSLKLAFRLAAWLFRVTSQATTDTSPFTDRFTSAGFTVTTDWVPLPTSRVLIIDAIRP